jgi:hypothetical protein
LVEDEEGREHWDREAEAEFAAEDAACERGQAGEDVLAEKGQDPRKIDEQLEAMKIKEAAQKKADGFGKKGFGLGNSWSAPGEEDNRSWRKPEAMETRPQRFVELVL